MRRCQLLEHQCWGVAGECRAVTVLLFLKARPNASLLEAASAWAMVLHALLGRRQKRPKHK